MKDFNNIETDPIPEGLEFNESYMHDAFALYDAEKSKRKRRLLIWWITSALGFSCVLLAGIFFFYPGKTSGNTPKKAFSGKETVAQRVSAGSDSMGTQQNQKDQTRNQHMQPGIDSARHRLTVSAVTSENHGNVNGANTRTSQRFKQGSFSGKNRDARPNTDKSVAASGAAVQTTGNLLAFADSASQTGIPDETPEITQNASGQLAEPMDLPLKPAMLAFAPDSVSKLPAYDPVPATENDMRRSHLYLNLGVNTLFGIKELKNRATFRESIGISYNYQLNPKLAIGAGLEYHSISRISYKRKIGDTTNSDKTTTTLNKTNLNYISFLPQVQYQLWPNHQLTAGFGIEYLLVDPGERYEIQNYTQESQKRTNSKLYYSTFNRFNFSVSLGYTYQFSRFMAVHASYYYGFTDVTINTGFNKTFDRNSRLQVGLKIKLY